MADAGGVTIAETQIGSKAPCPLLANVDRSHTDLSTVLDTMQTSIETAQAAADAVEALADGKIIVGNGSGVATDVAVSGDVTIANTGAVTIAAGAVEDSMIEALADGEILIGVDGTAANNAKVTVTGGVVIAKDGVATIQAAAVDETMLSSYAADGLHTKRIAKATYSYAEHGGTVSTIGLGVTLPDNAIVVRTFYEVITTLTSNSANDAATISFDIPTDDAAGLVAATAISAGTNTWDAGYHEGIQDGTAAAFAVKTTATRELSVTIGVEDIDAAGIVDFFCEYVVTE